MYPRLEENIVVDTVIIGGGITGLSAAYLLKKSGHSVAVLEKSTIGGGTTGRTTGKVTSQHNLIYADLYTRLGEKKARLYGMANQAAVTLVGKIIADEKIACDWEIDDNFVYTADQKQVRYFKKEAETAVRLGLPASFEKNIPLPFEVKGAVKFSGQGKIHSQKYLLGLAKTVDGNGSYVFENSNVIGIKDGRICRVRTSKGTVRSKNIIVATNVPTLPLMARGAYCILEYPTESYIVAGTPAKKLKGMYISPDKNHYSIFPKAEDSKQTLLIGGGGNISGLRLSKDKRYDKLANYAFENFGVKKITHRWSDRDYITYDGIPLAGKVYPWSKNLYVASAFRKWGLSNGTASAMIIHDLITGKKNAWAEVYSPIRLKPIQSIPRVFAQKVLRF
ncbi:FAD-binding oxidoreductase [Candidatus Parcubacteria bacterium]|nr:FAD-binding oxidoreductase [Candidatus Parcubacteria bacterium]